MLKVGSGREMPTCTGVYPFDNPVPQLFRGLTKILIPSPVDKSDVTVTLLVPCIQVEPSEVAVPNFQPLGNRYS